MGEKMTTIQLLGHPGAGFADWGDKTAPEMIDTLRKYALSQKAMADAVLSAEDKDFHVYTHTGVHVQRNKVVIQEGKTKTVPQLMREAGANVAD